MYKQLIKLLWCKGLTQNYVQILLLNLLASFSKLFWPSYSNCFDLLTFLCVTPGGAADSVRRLPTPVGVRVRGGVSSPDRRQAGPAGQGAEAGAGLWHHREGLCASGCYSGGGQVGHHGDREERWERLQSTEERLMSRDAIFKVFSLLTWPKI